MRPKAFNGADVAKMFAIFGVDYGCHMSSVKGYPELVRTLDVMKAEAKKSFKRMALHTHPDRNGGDDTEFKRLSATMDVLEKLRPAPPQPPRPRVRPGGFGTVTIVVNCVGGTDTTTGGW